jgi:hypothetical protein
MSQHRFIVDAEIDDQALSEHLQAGPEQGGDRPPFVSVGRWVASDLFSAYDEGFVLHAQMRQPFNLGAKLPIKVGAKLPIKERD